MFYSNMVRNVCFIFLVLFKCICIINADKGGKSLDSDNNGSGTEKDFDPFDPKIFKFTGGNLKHFENDDEETSKDDILTKFLNGNADPVARLLKKVCKKGASTKEQVDAIVAYITKIIKQNIHDTILMVSDEITAGPSHYACMTQGSATGLKKIKLGSTSFVPNNDSIDIHITYEFRNLHINYPKMFVSTWPLNPVTGVFDVDLNKSEIVIVLNVPNSEKLVERVLKKECIIALKGFGVKKIEYHDVRLTDGKDVSYDMVASVLSNFLQLNRSLLEFKLKFESLQEVRRCFQTAELVCKDNLDVIMLEDPDSEGFKNHCGSGTDQKPDAELKPDIGHNPDIGHKPGMGHQPDKGQKPGMGHEPNMGNKPDTGNMPNMRHMPDIGHKPGAELKPDIGHLDKGHKPGAEHNPDVHHKPKPSAEHNPDVHHKPSAEHNPDVHHKPKPSAEHNPDVHHKPSAEKKSGAEEIPGVQEKPTV